MWPKNILKNPCFSAIKPTFSWRMIFFKCVFLFHLLELHWGYLHLCLSVILVCNLCVCVCMCVIFVWFWYQSDGGFVEWIWEFSSTAIFWKSLIRIGVSFFLKFSRIWLWNHLTLGFCLEIFLLQFWFLCLWLVCSYFLSSCFHLEGYTFLRSYPFLPVVHFIGIAVHSSLWWAFVLLFSVVTSPFSFLILLFSVFLLSWWLWLMVCHFV